MTDFGMGAQQLRPLAEQQMSQWERDALDSHRTARQTDAAKHPAIMDALNRIEAKLDQLLARL